jgi:hypothetical protein
MLWYVGVRSNIAYTTVRMDLGCLETLHQLQEWMISPCKLEISREKDVVAYLSVLYRHLTASVV